MDIFWSGALQPDEDGCARASEMVYCVAAVTMIMVS